MNGRPEVCASCDYLTPAAEMTVWRTPIVTRVLAAPEARRQTPPEGGRWSGPFLYRPDVLEQRICVHCAARLEAGERFGGIGRNRLKTGLVVSLALVLIAAAAFPAYQARLASAFWQMPDENGRRAARYVVGSSAFIPGRSNSRVSEPR